MVCMKKILQVGNKDFFGSSRDRGGAPLRFKTDVHISQQDHHFVLATGQTLSTSGSDGNFL
jgi:hypothetical protein